MNATTTNEWYTVLINQDFETSLIYSRVGTSALFLILSLMTSNFLNLSLSILHSCFFLCN